MRFVSDDGAFGFRLAPTTELRFYTFQLIFGPNLLGETSPCIAGSCFGGLASIQRLDDPRLKPGLLTASETNDLLSTDERLSDGSLRHLAESLDGWATRMYVVDESVVVIAKQDRTGTGVLHRASVPLLEFQAMVEAMRSYWLMTAGDGR